MCQTPAPTSDTIRCKAIEGGTYPSYWVQRSLYACGSVTLYNARFVLSFRGGQGRGKGFGEGEEGGFGMQESSVFKGQ